MKRQMRQRSKSKPSVLVVQRIQNRTRLSIQGPTIIPGPKVHLKRAGPAFERLSILRRFIPVALKRALHFHLGR